MSGQWTDALAEVADSLNRGRIDWLLVGSAATALHGVAIDPGDIDVSVATPEDVARAAKLLPTTGEPTLCFDDSSSRWTLGRWLVDGVKVELVHIDDPATTHLVIETRGLLVWRERAVVEWRGHRIPLVPIEVQLATMIARQQETRIEATVAAVGLHSFDVSLLRRAIADRQSEGFAMTVPEELQRLLNPRL
jgi:hypothetical protein